MSGKKGSEWRVLLAGVALFLALIISIMKGQKAIPLREWRTNDFKEQVIMSPEHNYVLFNALGTTLPCPACAPSASVMATLNGKAVKGINLGTVELRNSRDLFEWMKLEAAPTLVYFPPGGREKPQVLDYRLTLDDKTITEWIRSTSGVEIASNGQDHVKKIQMGCLLITGVCLAWHFIGNSHAWSAIVGVFLLLMCTGLMWCRIRHTPVHGFQASGATQWIAPGMTSQYYVECFLLTALNALAALALGLLATHGHQPEHPWLSVCLSALVMAITWIAYASQIYLFRVKQPAYPFRFLTIF